MIHLSDPPLLSIVLINWNSALFIKNCINSLKRQTFKHFDLLFIDNSSTDGSVALFKRYSPHTRLIKNKINKGYAFAANQGIENTNGDMVLIMNTDVVLTKTFIENIIKEACKHEDTGSFGGKLLRFCGSEPKSNVIDSTGLVLCNSIRRPTDRGMLEKDTGQYNKSEHVFGINGAAVCYRRKMLNDIKICGEYFDKDFFCYFEDVDLAWRSVLFGWKSMYVSSAIAYHYRGGSKGENQIILRIYSSRNRYLIYLKNEPFIIFLKYLPLIIFVEFFRILKYMFREQVSIIGFLLFIKQIPMFLRKRKKNTKKEKN